MLAGLGGTGPRCYRCATACAAAPSPRRARPSCVIPAGGPASQRKRVESAPRVLRRAHDLARAIDGPGPAPVAPQGAEIGHDPVLPQERVVVVAESNADGGISDDLSGRVRRLRVTVGPVGRRTEVGEHAPAGVSLPETRSGAGTGGDVTAEPLDSFHERRCAASGVSADRACCFPTSILARKRLPFIDLRPRHCAGRAKCPIGCSIKTKVL